VPAPQPGDQARGSRVGDHPPRRQRDQHPTTTSTAVHRHSAGRQRGVGRWPSGKTNNSSGNASGVSRHAQPPIQAAHAPPGSDPCRLTKARRPYWPPRHDSPLGSPRTQNSQPTRWSYEDAWPEVRRISGLVSFELDKVAVHLDGTRLRLEPGQTVIPHGPDRDLTTGEMNPDRQP
jgi:hypothetical protein